jgi:hypothetical protein
MSSRQPHPRPKGKQVALTIDVQSIERVLDTAVSPFAGPELHPQVADYLMIEAKSSPGAERIEVVFRVPTGSGGSIGQLRTAVRRFGAEENHVATKEVREILKMGRYALFIGAIAVIILRGLSELMLLTGDYAMLKGLSESLVIFYWVILWRPAELLLYDHIQPRRRAKLGRLLANADVRVEYVADSELGR